MMSDKTYEIGLVMAGAVSAGAYTGGVLDYLQEALMHYQKVKRLFAKENPGKELHDVKIRVMSGASAGGMCGTMMLSSFMDSEYAPLVNFDPATIQKADIDRNVFYRSWVDKEQGIDISYFLKTTDLKPGKPLMSVLNCDRLETIADSALARPRKLQLDRGYISDRIEHFVTVFNLNGVPYTMDFQGQSAAYQMVNHADMMHFVVDENESDISSERFLLPEENNSMLMGNWTLLRNSTLATGAFPLALLPRVLSKSKDAYDRWQWWIPSEETCADKGRCFHLGTLPTSYSAPGEKYNFVSVDGGTANNEPLEVARRVLAGNEDFNPRDKNKAKRSILMVDPFPAAAFDGEFALGDANLGKLFFKLFDSLKDQARFKPHELAIARNPNVFSRYIVAPSRPGALAGQELACGSLGAFGGFFSEKFRQHDFQLGRYNCQRFLQQHFTIGQENPLVKENIDWFKQKGCLADGGDVQIIPMVNLPEHPINAALDPIDWKSIQMTQQELKTVLDLIGTRVEGYLDTSMVVRNVLDGIEQQFDAGWKRFLARQIVPRLRKSIKKSAEKRVTEAAQAAITKSFGQFGLLKE